MNPSLLAANRKEGIMNPCRPPEARDGLPRRPPHPHPSHRRTGVTCGSARPLALTVIFLGWGRETACLGCRLGQRDVQDVRPFLAPPSPVSSCASVFLETSGLSPKQIAFRAKWVGGGGGGMLFAVCARLPVKGGEKTEHTPASGFQNH